jgi:hypothetical protein
LVLGTRVPETVLHEDVRAQTWFRAQGEKGLDRSRWLQSTKDEKYRHAQAVARDSGSFLCEFPVQTLMQELGKSLAADVDSAHSNKPQFVRGIAAR